MRRFIIVLPAIFILSMGSGAVLGGDSNEIGLYCDPDNLSTTTIDLPCDSYQDFYLVLTNPRFLDSGKKVQLICGFECRVASANDDDLVAYANDAPHINFGAFPDLIVGFGFPCRVVGGQVVLGRITVFHSCESPSWYHLTQIENSLSIPGHMAFVTQDAHDELFMFPMYPVSGKSADPFISVSGSVVPAESETWGGVKSLYR